MSTVSPPSKVAIAIEIVPCSLNDSGADGRLTIRQVGTSTCGLRLVVSRAVVLQKNGNRIAIVSLADIETSSFRSWSTFHKPRRLHPTAG